jgi:hypothetical protein
MKISRKWSAKEGDVHASSVSVGLVGLMYIALHMAIKELWLDQHSRIPRKTATSTSTQHAKGMGR